MRACCGGHGGEGSLVAPKPDEGGSETQAEAQHHGKGRARGGRDNHFFSHGLNTDETRIYFVNLANHSINFFPFINSRR